MEISIVLPVYNESENLPRLLDEIVTEVGKLEKPYEILAIDDGSTDESWRVLKEYAEKNPALKIISFRRNAGQTAAFSAGFRYAEGRNIVTLDADGQNNPADIARLIAKLDEGYDCVTGKRKKRQDRWLSRKLPSLIANWFIRKITKTQATDLGCSLRVMRADVAKSLRLYGEMHRFLVPLVEGVGGRVCELEVDHRVRRHGSSKYGMKRLIKVPLDLLTVWFLRSLGTKPIYLFGTVGFVMMFLGLACAGVTLFEKIWWGIWVHKNPLLNLGVMFGILGTQFLGLGLIAELLIRTYFESQGKTPYDIGGLIGFGHAPTQSSGAAFVAVGNS